MLPKIRSERDDLIFFDFAIPGNAKSMHASVTQVTPKQKEPHTP